MTTPATRAEMVELMHRAMRFSAVGREVIDTDKCYTIDVVSTEVSEWKAESAADRMNAEAILDAMMEAGVILTVSAAPPVTEAGSDMTDRPTYSVPPYREGQP